MSNRLYGCAMENPESLRENAARCFRLARGVLDRELASKLTELGQTWETEAATIEAASASVDPGVRREYDEEALGGKVPDCTT